MRFEPLFLAALAGVAAANPAVRSRLAQRANRCGPGVGSCADTECCSSAGYCGVGADYCRAPDCQQNYGPACDANQRPSGVDTSGVERTRVGNVLYGGAGIYDCLNAGEIAITFDDGPYIYTSTLLDKLDQYEAKATFFITGNNLHKGQINDPSTPWPDMIRRMHDSGHQIGSHTWSHQNSSQTSAQQWTDQMVWNEIAINDILGFFPTYMRPPFSICESQCQQILFDLGYHIAYFDLDTQGYLHNDPVRIQRSKDILDAALANSSPANDAWLNIEHDIQEHVVNSLMDHMLEQLSSKGWKMVTMGKCMNDPKENWYRTVDGSSGGGGDGGNGGGEEEDDVSTDGTCGSGTTCQGSPFGNCCSQYGWCGTTPGHCGGGCQSEWGTCDGGNDGPAVSVDGSCGDKGDDGVTCQGSPFGNCCSQHGWCGSTDPYCGGGCQSQWGTCN